MKKPAQNTFEEFEERFRSASERAGKKPPGERSQSATLATADAAEKTAPEFGESFQLA